MKITALSNHKPGILNKYIKIFFAQLHSILKYSRILNTRHHPRIIQID
jgi:hypothetical protein